MQNLCEKQTDWDIDLITEYPLFLFIDVCPKVLNLHFLIDNPRLCICWLFTDGGDWLSIKDDNIALPNYQVRKQYKHSGEQNVQQAVQYQLSNIAIYFT